jgi:hypothetical protein
MSYAYDTMTGHNMPRHAVIRNAYAVFQDTKIAAAKKDFIGYKMAKGACQLLTQLRNKKILTVILKNRLHFHSPCPFLSQSWISLNVNNLKSRRTKLAWNKTTQNLLRFSFH